MVNFIKVDAFVLRIALLFSVLSVLPIQVQSVNMPVDVYVSETESIEDSSLDVSGTLNEFEYQIVVDRASENFYSAVTVFSNTCEESNEDYYTLSCIYDNSYYELYLVYKDNSSYHILSKSELIFELEDYYKFD